MKHIFQKIRKNTAILIASFLCALAIFSITKNPNLFLSSVLSIKEQQLITTKNRDAAYKTQSGILEIFLAPQYTNNFQNIETTLYFKKGFTDPQIHNLSGKGMLNYQEIGDGEIKITLQNMSQIDTSQEIISIPFSGDAAGILLGESQAMSGNQWIPLSIGNLNATDSHSNK